MTPPTFNIAVASTCVCSGCGKSYDADALLRRGAVVLDRAEQEPGDVSRELLLPCYCPCGASTFVWRVRIG